MEQVLQAPNGKFYFKKYNDHGDSIFCSDIIYKSETEADKAMKEHKMVKVEKKEVVKVTEEVVKVVGENKEEALKAVKKTVKKAK